MHRRGSDAAGDVFTRNRIMRCVRLKKAKLHGWLLFSVALALASWPGQPWARIADAQSNEARPTTTPSETPAGAVEENPNPLQFKADLAIWTFVVFVVLFLVLKKFAWGPISESLDRREHHIAENIEAAKRTHEDARQLLAQYERQLAAAADEVRGMLDEARHDAETTKQQIIAEAKSAAQAEHARAVRDIRTAADAAVEDLSQRSADLAVLLAGKIISAKISPEERSRLVQDSLGKFAAATPSRN
jgi:F-type H+-transporting ATPase subunit b